MKIKTLLFILFVLLLTSCATANPQPTAIVDDQKLTIEAQTPVATSETAPTATLPAPSGVFNGRFTPGKAFELPFPRLGMWWPNLITQKLDQVDRYDMLVLNNWEHTYIDTLRAAKPGILLLNSTNACEISYSVENEEMNKEIAKLPAGWFLTQVGSELSEDVDAQTTTFKVKAFTAGEGDKLVELFLTGETALIEGESVLIQNVDKANGTLTVQRGFVRPASAHKAGTRIASHISFWPKAWMLNLSTLSTKGVIDPTVGEETWAQYRARMDLKLLADPGWDGMLIDRTDMNESWLIGNSSARSIDPDQSNTLLSDYSAFDRSWNEGLQAYEYQMRSLIGPDKLLMVNWGMPNYDLLNGSNYEGFPPNIASPEYWPNHVLSKTYPSGSYFEWLSRAMLPNVSMIQTYQDDSAPDPTVGRNYDNPCNKPGFVPDYRKFRFGLTTALLGDGFYSFELNTDGHGSLCLLWFDEYDNAGQGKGYLGQPLGPAQQVQTVPGGSDEVHNGQFETVADMEQWNLGVYTEAGYEGKKLIDNGSIRVDVTKALGESWKLALTQGQKELLLGETYTLSFSARADVPRKISSWMQQTVDPWQIWLYFEDVDLTTEWKNFSISGRSTGNDTSANLTFGLGKMPGSVYLDDVTLTRNGKYVWRRDYQNGIVVTNPLADAQFLVLGASYRKIRGNQDPVVNDGSTVTEITLPAYDGLILLK